MAVERKDSCIFGETSLELGLEHIHDMKQGINALQHTNLYKRIWLRYIKNVGFELLDHRWELSTWKIR